MNPSKKLVFFGTEDFSLPSLKVLVEHGFSIACVVTKPDSARGRSKKLVAPAVKTYAITVGIPVLQPNKLGDIYNQLSELQADAGVLVSYGKIIPKRILDLFSPIGIINLHPSLLPRYRGPAPIEASILHGDSQTGVSIMQLSEGMDEGPVYFQVPYALDGDETKPELYSRLATEGASQLIAQLPSILNGELEAKPQQTSDVSYTSLLTRDNGIVNPTTDTATTIERNVRAYLGFPKTRCRIKNNDVIITSSKIVTSLSSDQLVISCAENTYLEVTELVAPSGKTMSGYAYLRGYAG